MPRVFVPHKSSLHRIACLSLYRALLRESARAAAAVPTSQDAVREALRSLIRTRFQKDKRLLSPTQAANGLLKSHDSLQLLRECNSGSAPAWDQLNKILASVKVRADQLRSYRAELASRWKAPPESRRPHMENLRANADEQNQKSTPSGPRVFQNPRPLPEMKSGVRKVPNMILAHGIPVLKYPGPTPVLLNRVLKTKIQWSLKKWDQHKRLQHMIEIAEAENQWDDLLERRFGIDRDRTAEEESVFPLVRKMSSDTPQGLVSKLKAQQGSPLGHVRLNLLAAVVDSPEPDKVLWTTCLKHADTAIHQAVLARGRKYATLGNKLYTEVIVPERALKEKERKEAKHARRMVRKGLPIGGGYATGTEGNGVSSIAEGYI